jgi:ribosomal protein S18 acetylase RimI-like enzyme
MSNEAPSPSNISLRPVVSDDYDFLLTVYASTRADEMALVSWTDGQRAAFVQSQFGLQQDHYSKKYPTASHDVILSNGMQVGRLYVARLEKEIRIADITLLPSERNAGIGTYLLKKLMDEAHDERKITTIYVEVFNPSLSLFKRLGFEVRQQDGFHLLMEFTPTTITNPIG